GRGRDWLFFTLLGSCITVASFVAGLPFGPAGVAISYSVGGLFIGVPTLFYFAGREGPVTTADLWGGIFRYLPLWIVVCGVTWLVHLLFLSSAPLVQLVVSSALLLVCAVVLKGVYPFLAITHPVNANILVVEGWIHEYAIRAAVKEFQSNHYQRVFTTGGPVAGTGGYINDFYTSASVGADLLKKWGIPDERLQMVPSRVMDRDRTYGSAVALRNWFRDHNMAVSSIDVITE